MKALDINKLREKQAHLTALANAGNIKLLAKDKGDDDYQYAQEWVSNIILQVKAIDSGIQRYYDALLGIHKAGTYVAKESITKLYSKGVFNETTTVLVIWASKTAMGLRLKDKRVYTISIPKNSTWEQIDITPHHYYKVIIGKVNKAGNKTIIGLIHEA